VPGAPRARSHPWAAWLGLAALLVCGCRHGEPPDPWRAALQSHLERGVAALAQAPTVPNSGAVWSLQRLYPERQPRLDALIARSIASQGGDPTARLNAPSLPPPSIPSDPGRGVARLSVYLQAPYGAPAQRAADFLRDFLATPGDGYILTHQLLALLWSEQFGVVSRDDAAALRAPLVARLLAEQSAAPAVFSDLYAERVALLLTFSPVPPPQRDAWLATIIAAQHEDGRWVDDGVSPLLYDGQQASAQHDWTHTSVHAVVALALGLRAPAATPTGEP
jgi:hypothetical protein